MRLGWTGLSGLSGDGHPQQPEAAQQTCKRCKRTSLDKNPCPKKHNDSEYLKFVSPRHSLCLVCRQFFRSCVHGLTEKEWEAKLEEAGKYDEYMISLKSYELELDDSNGYLKDPKMKSEMPVCAQVNKATGSRSVLNGAVFWPKSVYDMHEKEELAADACSTHVVNGVTYKGIWRDKSFGEPTGTITENTYVDTNAVESRTIATGCGFRGKRGVRDAFNNAAAVVAGQETSMEKGEDGQTKVRRTALAARTALDKRILSRRTSDSSDDWASSLLIPPVPEEKTNGGSKKTTNKRKSVGSGKHVPSGPSNPGSIAGSDGAASPRRRKKTQPQKSPGGPSGSSPGPGGSPATPSSSLKPVYPSEQLRLIEQCDGLVAEGKRFVAQFCTECFPPFAKLSSMITKLDSKQSVDYLRKITWAGSPENNELGQRGASVAEAMTDLSTKFQALKEYVEAVNPCLAHGFTDDSNDPNDSHWIAYSLDACVQAGIEMHHSAFTNLALNRSFELLDEGLEGKEADNGKSGEQFKSIVAILSDSDSSAGDTAFGAIKMKNLDFGEGAIQDMRNAIVFGLVGRLLDVKNPSDISAVMQPVNCFINDILRFIKDERLRQFLSALMLIAGIEDAQKSEQIEPAVLQAAFETAHSFTFRGIEKWQHRSLAVFIQYARQLVAVRSIGKTLLGDFRKLFGDVEDFFNANTISHLNKGAKKEILSALQFHGKTLQKFQVRLNIIIGKANQRGMDEWMKETASRRDTLCARITSRVQVLLKLQQAMLLESFREPLKMLDALLSDDGLNDEIRLRTANLVSEPVFAPSMRPLKQWGFGGLLSSEQEADYEQKLLVLGELRLALYDIFNLWGSEDCEDTVDGVFNPVAHSLWCALKKALQDQQQDREMAAAEAPAVEVEEVGVALNELQEQVTTTIEPRFHSAAGTWLAQFLKKERWYFTSMADIVKNKGEAFSWERQRVVPEKEFLESQIIQAQMCEDYFTEDCSKDKTFWAAGGLHALRAWPLWANLRVARGAALAAVSKKTKKT